MNKQIRGKKNILIVKIFLLIFIIFGNLIVFYYKNEFKASEFLKNYNKNKIFEFSQSISISKAFEILRAHQFNFLLKKKVTNIFSLKNRNYYLFEINYLSKIDL